MTTRSVLSADVEIRRFTADDSIEELTELVHRAYAQLADLGLRYWATHQPPEITARRIARGECFVCVSADRIIATATLTRHDQASGHPWYDRPEVAAVGQFGVVPDRQRVGVGSGLLCFIEQRAAEQGAAELALDTAEPARHLLEFYGRRGYRLVGRAQWEGVNYTSVIMSKRLPAAGA
jgi:GNAT superfamily N-acetyltransferase